MRLSFLALIALAACADTTTDTDTDTDPADTASDDTDVTGETGETGETGDTGAPADVAVTLTFDALVGTQQAACGATYADQGTADTTVTLKDFRLYVHDVRLLDASGTAVPVTLDQTSAWQHEGVALLDFEDKTADCSEFGTVDTNDRIVGTAPAGTYTGVAFKVGVPFEFNHVAPATAPSPLNASGMFWVWKSGYKYLRIDFLDDASPANGWNIHLGAGGCESADAMTPPSSPCAKPNIPEIRLTGFDPLTDTISLDAAALVANADVSVNTASTPPGCMSNPMEPDDCGPVFGALGLDFATGACADGCADQTFAVVP